jgi:hypothetical protein
MPRGPRGEKRPADVIGNAVKVMRIATGEETEEIDHMKSAAAELGSRGGKARAASMSPARAIGCFFRHLRSVVEIAVLQLYRLPVMPRYGRINR